MLLLLEIPSICFMINQIGLTPFYLRLCDVLIQDFINWDAFHKSKRHAVYVPNGVIELMPICNNDLYTFKYVNGHPHNPATNKLNVVAFGVLADVHNGYPLMIASMTVLTAIRTAATSALASKQLAKKGSRTLAIIGCGSQSEFQVLAHHALFDLLTVRYYDIDPHAMARFAANLHAESFTLSPAMSIIDAIDNVDIIITATAVKGKHLVLTQNMLKPGQHISAIGGDAPGKTELDPALLKQSKVVVEYFPQTHQEGEIQNLGADAIYYVYAELWQLLNGDKPGRTDETEITVFDSVGFALEDFSVLRLCYELATELKYGHSIDLVPTDLLNCKNLYGYFIGNAP